VTRQSAPWITITGLDGAGKTTLLQALSKDLGGFQFRLPYHAFVRELLNVSGKGTAFGDVHTDRLLFATDARLTNCLIQDWRHTHPILLSQRGWMDNFIFGAVQGVTYEETDQLLRTSELERPSAIIYLTADPQVAFCRIAADPLYCSSASRDVAVLQLCGRRPESLGAVHRHTRDPHRLDGEDGCDRAR
jgi:thymidylate kinase